MRFVETPVFTTAIDRHLDDERCRQLQIALMLRPEQGPVMQKSGGFAQNPLGDARCWQARRAASDLLLGT